MAGVNLQEMGRIGPQVGIDEVKRQSPETLEILQKRFLLGGSILQPLVHLDTANLRYIKNGELIPNPKTGKFMTLGDFWSGWGNTINSPNKPITIISQQLSEEQDASYVLAF